MITDWIEMLHTEDDIPSELENQDIDLSMNSFVNELVQKTLEGVKQDIADEQTVEAIHITKVARQKMYNGSESDEESDFEDFMEVRQSSVTKLMRFVNQVENTTLASLRFVFNETNTGKQISSLHPYCLMIIDDCSKDELISEDNIPSELDYQDTDLSMNSFVNELVQKTLEGVKQDIADEQTAEAIHITKVARQKMYNGSESDEESDFENFMESRLAFFNTLMTSDNQVECTTLSTTRPENNPTMTLSRLHLDHFTIMADWFGKPDEPTVVDDTTSAAEYQDIDDIMNTGRPTVLNTTEGVAQGIAQKDIAINLTEVTSQKMDNESMKLVNRSSLDESKATEMSGSEDDSDFEDFLEDRRSSVHALLSSIDQAECPSLESTRSGLSEINTTMGKLTQVIPSVNEEHVHNAKRSTSISDAERAQSASCVRKMFGRMKKPLNKSLSESNTLNARITFGVADISAVPFEKNNSLIPQSDKTCPGSQYPTIQSDKRFTAPANAKPDTLDKTSLNTKSVNCALNTKLPTNINPLQQQVPCNGSKKSSFVKRAGRRISGALRRMARVFTACCSGSRSSARRNANGVPPNNIVQ